MQKSAKPAVGPCELVRQIEDIINRARYQQLIYALGHSWHQYWLHNTLGRAALHDGKKYRHHEWILQRLHILIWVENESPPKLSDDEVKCIEFGELTPPPCSSVDHMRVYRLTLTPELTRNMIQNPWQRSRESFYEFWSSKGTVEGSWWDFVKKDLETMESNLRIGDYIRELDYQRSAKRAEAKRAELSARFAKIQAAK